MIGKHPLGLPVPSESHAYSTVYDPFTYLPQWSFQRRQQAAAWVIRHYGLKPLLTGITPQDIWRSLPGFYDLYKQGKNTIGLHRLANREDFTRLLHQAKSREGSDLSKAEDLIAALFQHFFEANQGTAEHIMLEKTPMHIRYVDKILSRFPEAKVIEVVRDGRDVDVSYKARAKTQRWAHDDSRRVIGQWQRCVNLGARFHGDPQFAERIYRVRYEQLRANPTQELCQAFDFLGLEYTSNLMSQIVAANDISQVASKGEGLHVRKGSVGEWRSSLSQEQIDLWRELAGETLEKLGYGW